MYDEERRRTGRVPALVQTFAARPAVYAAWRALITEITATMPARRYELVTLAAARELRSTYCSVVHGSLLADRFLPAEDVRDLARGDVPAALDDQDRAVVAFAAKAAHGARDIGPDDVESLRRQGLTDDEILDVALATAARCFFSTVLDATGTQAEASLGTGLRPDLLDALTVGRPLAGG
jgi:alkylhydroperoxidase family enzyme